MGKRVRFPISYYNQGSENRKNMAKNTREGVGRTVPQPSSNRDKHQLDAEGGACCCIPLK